MLSNRRRAIGFALAVIALVWVVAWIGHVLARNSRMTADKFHRYVQSVDFGDQTAALEDCMRKLSEHQRECLSLRYVEAMSVGQIAERMNRRENSIAATLYRARLALAHCIEDTMARRGRP